ncbi:hypothetical protein AVEN_79524-1 [Araneus ventricosus]|uniref:Uncharacterized protein n=1 Tax=Araneus ventricosus TaxID=182803 RepID=A0A4Y2WPE7_ARAVE|nr:hypothetical protein AVEN_79524-1 [Araneus ventricosus]
MTQFFSPQGIGFGDFTLHMLPVVVLSVVGSYLLLRFMYRNVSHLRFADPPEVVGEYPPDWKFLSRPFTSVPEWNFRNTERKKAIVTLKRAIHLCYIPVVPRLVFFSTHSSRKIRHVHSSEVPKCAGSRGERSSFPLYS